MPYADRWKRAQASRDHYLRNRGQVIAQAASAKPLQRKASREYVRSLKEGKPCVDCGVVYPHYVLEFDHVRGEKRASIADLVSKNASLKILRAEIAKCELVCANCHRARTWKRANGRFWSAATAEIDAVPALF